MDKIRKLFKKLSKQERVALQEITYLLEKKQLEGLDIVKIKGTDWFRVKKGRVRVFFNYQNFGNLQIRDVRTRNEKTYKDV